MQDPSSFGPNTKLERGKHMQKTVELTTPRDSFSSSSKFLIEVGKNNLTIYASNHACHQWTLLINDD